MTTPDDLPRNISRILESLARWARGYSSGLKWDEEAKLKADLMHNRHHWLGVSLEAIRAKCRAEGLSDEDTRLIADLVGKAQAGRRLVAQRSYRNYRWNHEALARTEPLPEQDRYGDGADASECSDGAER